MADINFETGDEQLQDFNPIPPGTYQAMVETSELRDTEAGGKGLNLTWIVLDGEYAGRKVFDWVNLVNASEKAQEIGRKQLNTIAAALGYPVGSRIRQSEELHDKPCIIDVKIQPAGKDKKGIDRDAKNTIKGYHPLEAAGTPAPTLAQQYTGATKPAAPAPRPAAPAPQPAMAGAGSNGKPPWKR